MLTSDSIKDRLNALKEAAHERIQQASRSLEEEANEQGVALVIVTAGQLVRPAIFPRVDDQPALKMVRSMPAIQGPRSLGTVYYVVERTPVWIGHFRRIKLCYKKTGAHFQIFKDLTACLSCANLLKRLNTL